MATYSVVTIAAAEKQIQAAPFPFRRRLVHALMKMKQQPRPAGSQVIEGDLHRQILDGWAILYTVDDEERVVTVLRVRPLYASPR